MIALAGSRVSVKLLIGIGAGRALSGTGSNAAGTIRLEALIDNEDILVDSPRCSRTGELHLHVRRIVGTVIDILLIVEAVCIRAAGIVGLCEEVRCITASTGKGI